MKLVAKTLDLNAGQLIDRVGLMLGLPFPCGMQLDTLSLGCTEKVKARPSFKGVDCCLSGGENQAKELLKKGAPPEVLARFAVEFVKAAVDGMTDRVMAEYGKKPVLYAGGVMSNRIIRAAFEEKHGGYFAAPEFSSDNATGPAILASIFDKERQE